MFNLFNCWYFIKNIQSSCRTHVFTKRGEGRSVLVFIENPFILFSKSYDKEKEKEVLNREKIYSEQKVRKSRGCFLKKRYFGDNLSLVLRVSETWWGNVDIWMAFMTTIDALSAFCAKNGWDKTYMQWLFAVSQVKYPKLTFSSFIMVHRQTLIININQGCFNNTHPLETQFHGNVFTLYQHSNVHLMFVRVCQFSRMFSLLDQ